MNTMLLAPLAPHSLSTEELQGKGCDLLVGTPDGNVKVPGTVIADEQGKLVVETALSDFDDIFPVVSDLDLKVEGWDELIALDGCEFVDGSPALDMASNDVSTTLELVISDISWESNYSMGAGLDALTNSVCNKAVQVSETRPERPTRISTSATMISTAEEYAKAFEVAVDGHYNTGMVDIKGSMSYMSDVKTSKTSLSIVLEYRVEEESYNSESDGGRLDYEFTPQAAKTLAEGKGKFRDLYGDYFFADLKKGSRFIAVYNCTSTSESDIQSFKAALSVDGDLYGAAASTSLKTAAKASKITTSVKMHYIGCKGSPVYGGTDDVMDVGKAVQWFTTHLSPVPIAAKVMHYSAIDASIPRTVPVAPEKFIAIWKMFSQLWRLVGRARNCPANYTARATDRAEEIRREIVSHQQSYITRPDLITDFNTKIVAAVAYIEGIENKRALYGKLLAAKDGEPATGENNMKCADYGVWRWEYGVINYPGATTSTYDVKEDSKFCTFRHGEATFQDATRTVVGYVVTSNWHDDTGGKWYLQWKGLGQHSVGVHLKSYLHRGFSWTVTVYSVPNSEIDFPAA